MPTKGLHAVLKDGLATAPRAFASRSKVRGVARTAEGTVVLLVIRDVVVRTKRAGTRGTRKTFRVEVGVQRTDETLQTQLHSMTKTKYRDGI